MELIGKDILHKYKLEKPETKSDLDALEAEIADAHWTSPHDLKARYPKVSIIGGRHVVFNIYGNKYRLWVQISYKSKIVVTIKIGTHKEYDQWKIK